MRKENESLQAYETRIEILKRTAHLPPDFTYWSKLPYWSTDESVALLLGRDPEIITSDILIPDPNWPVPLNFILEYRALRNLVLRGVEIEQIEARNAPAVFLEWAEKRGLDIPQELWEPVMIRKRISPEIQEETECLLKAKDEKIAMLQKQLDELKTVVWEGFDENVSTYSKELALAVKAHAAVSKSWKKGKSIKQQITVWLENNHPKLGNEERERIAKICNWQKGGGAPSTP